MEQRTSDLEWALEQFHWRSNRFIRGGYGTSQILDITVPINKEIIGFSMQMSLTHAWKIGSTNMVHGPVLIYLLMHSRDSINVKEWLELVKFPHYQTHTYLDRLTQ